MENKNKVFKEWGYELIPSSYGELNGEKRYYRVVIGSVTWHTSDPGAIHKACFPIVQFGDERDYEKALDKGAIKLNYPCHILEEDMDAVMEAMNALRNKF